MAYPFPGLLSYVPYSTLGLISPDQSLTKVNGKLGNYGSNWGPLNPIEVGGE